eukprot:NODE_253_length_1082_cov_1004.693194_g246_i0.p1 GENE.NODE_253_length_1082_cov_1004.693194_g246_i0~~NODE_253_length_1082_cov_1004.693194_g246_i0.p1  ORF type:complete len:295 (+),score=86.43 NODE_253_length_1082_cov_1004.693194_g246_i0:54-887(+)
MPAKKPPPKAKGKKAPAKQAKKAQKAPIKGKKGSKGGKQKKPIARKITRFANLFESRPRNFSIGQDLPPKRDVTRFVKWPKYVRIQRHRRMLERRLKVPPTVNQFRTALGEKHELMKFAKKYKVTSKKVKKEAVRRRAEDKAGKMKTEKGKRTPTLKFGLKRVTRLIESQRAKLVLIAHDVVPLEVVVWLPALCKKLDVPYAIVKSKSALGRLAGFKTASCCAFLDVKTQDQSQLANFARMCKENFNEKRPSWGGLIKGAKGVKTGRRKQPKSQKKH